MRTMPHAAGLALNLDGCRFGDCSPNNHQHLSRRRRREQQQSKDEKNCKYNNDNDEDNNINIDDVDGRPRRQCSLDDHYLPSPPPPSPMGMTYRHEGLSIGRDFLRFRGSTVSHRLSADDLHVETCLGRGACSSVWRARRRRRRSSSSCRQQQRRNTGDIVEKECEEEEDDDDEYYALKLFSLRDPNQRTMLVRELTLLCTFRCDCLVQMEGAFLDLVNKDNGNEVRSDGGGVAASSREGSSSLSSSSSSGNTVTLVLEYMDRGSLADLIVAAKVEKESEVSTMIPEYAIAAMAYQILWGLSYLHYEGVLHRDIKPANVLVSSSGRVKLADFGIVSKQKQLLRRSYDDDGDINDGTVMNRTVIGTTRYMSPERLRGEAYKRSSDVWSIGLVLLEIVRGGVSPFEDVTSVVELVQTLDECRMNDFIPKSTSNGLREILVGCFDHCPHKRIPASILLFSPWFQSHNIHDVKDASSLMMVYLDNMK